MKPTTEQAKEFLIKELNMSKIQAETLYKPYIDTCIKFAEHSINELLNPKQIDKIKRDVIINEYKESLKEECKYTWNEQEECFDTGCQDSVFTIGDKLDIKDNPDYYKYCTICGNKIKS